MILEGEKRQLREIQVNKILSEYLPQAGEA